MPYGYNRDQIAALLMGGQVPGLTAEQARGAQADPTAFFNSSYFAPDMARNPYGDFPGDGGLGQGPNVEGGPPSTQTQGPYHDMNDPPPAAPPNDPTSRGWGPTPDPNTPPFGPEDFQTYGPTLDQAGRGPAPSFKSTFPGAAIPEGPSPGVATGVQGGAMSPGFSATGYPSGVGFPGGIDPEEIGRGDQQGPPAGAKGNYGEEPQSFLSDPEAMSAFASAPPDYGYGNPGFGGITGYGYGQGPQGTQAGYEFWAGTNAPGYDAFGDPQGQGEQGTAPGDFGFASEAEQTAWGDAYAGAIAEGQTDAEAAATADDAVGAGGYGSDTADTSGYGSSDDEE